MEFTKGKRLKGAEEELDDYSSQPLPVPPEHDDGDSANIHRVWIGNLPVQASEYSVLRLVQPFGELDKLDFICHKAGPDKGKRQNYCFVTYKTPDAAQKAVKGIHG